MSATRTRGTDPPLWLRSVFDCIVCGVDGTESSRVAVDQAVRLLPARRPLQLVSVVEESPMPWSPAVASVELGRRHAEAQRALGDAHVRCPRAGTRLAFGEPGRVLADAVRELQASLVAVGAPRSGRLGGLVLGDVGTHLLHRAPCSVLIARPCSDESAFPRSIVVGHDGSSAAAAAAVVAKELAARFDARLVVLAASGGDPVQTERLGREDALEWSELPPVDALVEASRNADLLVVGSRGLRGLRSLGSVSERVGHLAQSSVLVVRPPAAPTGAPQPVDEPVEDAVPDLEC